MSGEQLNQLRNQISEKNTSLQTLIDKDIDYTRRYDEGLSNLNKLEQELNDLLFYKKKTLSEHLQLESLVNDSNKLQFVSPGYLEGHFLNRIQDKVSGNKEQQKVMLSEIEQNLQQMRVSEMNLERDLEEQRQMVYQLDQLIAINESNIHKKRMEIATLESKLRTLN